MQDIEKEEFSYGRLFGQTFDSISGDFNLIFRRSLLIFWPVILYTLLFVAMGLLNLWDLATFSALVVVPIIVVYITALSHICAIERVLMIDACWDGQAIESERSFRIARRLFWPSLILRLRMIFRYHLFQLALYGLNLYLLFLSLGHFINGVGGAAMRIGILIWFIGTTVVFGGYVYWIGFRFRFFWFVFLDRYGLEDCSFAGLREEINKLNVASGTGFLKKSFFARMGIEAAGYVSDVASTRLAGISGTVLSASAFGWARVAADYLFYRSVRALVYGSEQKVNQNVYALVPKALYLK